MSDHDERDDYDDSPWRGRIARADLLDWSAKALWGCAFAQLVAIQIGTAILAWAVVNAADEEAVGFGDIRPLACFLGSSWFLASTVQVLIMRLSGELRRFRRYRTSVVATLVTM